MTCMLPSPFFLFVCIRTVYTNTPLTYYTSGKCKLYTYHYPYLWVVVSKEALRGALWTWVVSIHSTLNRGPSGRANLTGSYGTVKYVLRPQDSPVHARRTILCPNGIPKQSLARFPSPQWGRREQRHIVKVMQWHSWRPALLNAIWIP